MLEVSESRNLDQIAGLSQRGKMLSIVDLVAANTITAEMAAVAFQVMSQGSSVLTAAMPGNAGKTTLLSCMATALPAGSHITTIDSPETLATFDGRMDHPEIMLIHEIGPAPIFSYLWGEHITRAFGLIQPNRYLVSCIHADTLDQLYQILTSEEFDLVPEDLAKIDLILFMNLEQIEGGYRRRVATMYEAFGDATEHRLLFQWNPDEDTFAKMDRTPLLERLAASRGSSVEAARARIAQTQQFIEDLQRQGVDDFRHVRQQFLEAFTA